MTRARLVRLAAVVSALAFIPAGRVDAQFPKEGEANFGAKLKAAIATIKPLPEAPIPDDPPPHEGAMIDLPCVVAPPDLLLIEVLEALPGRPITGERLVRPDGTITLGFYGSVHVRGLTLEQIKIKITEHLRIHLPDGVLGLIEEATPTPDAPDPAAPSIPPADLPPLPSREPFPIDLDGPKGAPVRPSPDGANVPKPKETRPRTEPEMPEPRADVPGTQVEIAPEESRRVFVDISAYNSKFYYVQGDVSAPGKLPWTGNETVLDALNFASGFLPTADPSDIRLIRPARGGKPLKVYSIDYKAITERGDKALNYQVFPGDRIIVSRNKMIVSTIMIDRLAAAFQSLVNSSLQATFMLRSFVAATPDLTPAQREALHAEWFKLWWKAANRPGGPIPEEKTFQELLHGLMKPAPGTAAPEKK